MVARPHFVLASVGGVARVLGLLAVTGTAASEARDPLSTCDSVAIDHPDLPIDVTYSDREVTWFPLGVVCTWAKGDGTPISYARQDWLGTIMSYGLAAIGVGCLIGATTMGLETAAGRREVS
jgi:hypothetical protein